MYMRKGYGLITPNDYECIARLQKAHTLLSLVAEWALEKQKEFALMFIERAIEELNKAKDICCRLPTIDKLVTMVEGTCLIREPQDTDTCIESVFEPLIKDLKLAKKELSEEHFEEASRDHVIPTMREIANLIAGFGCWVTIYGRE